MNLLAWIEEEITEKPNEKGLYENDLLVPKTHANYLWTTSWLSLISSIYALKKGHQHLVIVPFSVYCSSLLHWQHPTQSWRRALDITVCNSALFYQLYQAQNASHKLPYYFTTALAAAFYPLSLYFYKKRQTKLATFSHSLLHICGNLSNFILYCGQIS